MVRMVAHAGMDGLVALVAGTGSAPSAQAPSQRVVYCNPYRYTFLGIAGNNYYTGSDITNNPSFGGAQNDSINAGAG